ncbi:MAG: thioredoxin family protein [Planctomycetales bacterium]|nr:thioredoxin family protein [Planctomycetales bacterium]
MDRLYAMLITLTVAATANAQGIAWAPSIEAARAAAAQQQRLVLLHFYSDNCPPCRRLETNVFPQSSVLGAMSQGYIPVKINTAVDQQLTRQYNISSWPTDVITDPKGRELHRRISPQDANQYALMLQSTFASYRSALPYQQQIDGASSQLAAAGQGAFSQLATNAAQYQQSIGEQLNQTQQYTQHVAQQYQQQAADQLAAAQQYGQQYAQQASQSAQQQLATAQQYGQQYVQQAQNQLAGAQQVAQDYTQSAQQTAGQFQQGVQNSLDATQQSLQSYAGSATAPLYGTANPYATPDVYGGGATPATPPVDGATSPYQAANVYGATTPGGETPINPAVQGAVTPSAAGITNDAQLYGQAMPPAGNSLYNQPLQGNTVGADAPSEATASGQLTTNPYVQQSGPAMPGSTGVTAPYNQLYAGQANAAVQAPAPTAPAIAPAPAYQPTKPNPVALDGFCAVTLKSREKWAKGDTRFGVVHRSRTYLFRSKQEQELFLADPDAYAPMLSGYDPVAYRKSGQLVAGHRAHGLTYKNHMFLFASEQSLEEFSASPEAYLGIVQQAMNSRPMTR